MEMSLEKKKNLILLRTHYFDDGVAEIVSSLSKAGLPLFIVADETNKNVNVPREINKISVNESAMEKLGLLNIDKAPYYCGDYSAIIAAN
jgi:hypothetical protein